MNLSFIQLGLLGFLRLATSTFVAGWVSSPMSWSPDGEWLSYTVVTDAEPDELRAGMDLSHGRTSDADARRIPDAGRAGDGGPAAGSIESGRHNRSRQPSVLIEESHWPLTAPAWSPRGKSIAFGRFVPQSIEPAQSIQRGRYEVVIQDGLDRKQVVWSSPDFELDPIARAGLPHLSCSWSPDGLYLAIPRPGRQPAIEIVRTDTKKRVHMIEHASLPSWSPDGSKCAFIRQDERRPTASSTSSAGARRFGEPRLIAATGAIASAPHWSSDSRSIFAVVERTTRPIARSRNRSLHSGAQWNHAAHAPGSRSRHGGAATIRGVAIDFDREGERCFFSVDLEGRDSDVVWSIPRERVTHKRFHPLDISQRIEGLAVSPDGQLVAVRFGSPRRTDRRRPSTTRRPSRPRSWSPMKTPAKNG